MSQVHAVAWVLIIVSMAPAASNPQATELRNRIKALRAQEKAVIQNIRAEYSVVLGKTQLDKAHLSQTIRQLRIDEKELLRLTKDKTQRANIRARYKKVIAVLTGEEHLDAAGLREARAQERDLVKVVRVLYKDAINVLEKQLHALPKTRSNRKPKG